jgi:hypothetical protein
MSLRFVLFDLTLFAKGDDPKESRKDLGWLLEGLCQRDMAFLKEHPDTPLLYQSGVTYERPAQFQGLCPEAAVLKNALGPMANDPQVADVLETVQAALGGERFRDIGRIIENGSGDCFPTGTRVLRRDGSLVGVETLSTGDEIWGRNRWSTVKSAWQKPILLPTREITCAGDSFRVTDDHKLFIVTDGGGVARIEAREVSPGMKLIAPRYPREITSSFDSQREYNFAPFDSVHDIVRMVTSTLSGNRDGEEVWDLTTDDHYVYLPEANVTVSQCDNVATWRAAELRQNGIAASPFITWRKRADGGMTYHVLVRWPDNTLEDPSLLLGMSQPERAADRQEEIRKNNERIQMVKDAAARKPLPTSVVGAGGHRNAHRNVHRNISQPVLIPTDEYGMVDLDLDLDDDGLERSFDERLLAHTGLLRGM